MVYSERPIRPQDQTSTAKSMISSGNNSNQQKLDRKQKQGSHTLRGPAHVEQIHSTNNINNNNSSSSSIYGSREKKGPRKDKLKWWKRVRIRVALLGLAVAVANCYAQATFCIAIVEMVLPADYISSQGAQSSSQSSQPPLTATSTTTNSSSTRPLNQLTALEANESSHIAMEDNSCPLEFKYRNFYDSWRFEPTDSESQTTSASMDNKQRQHHHQMDTSNRFDWDASQQGLLLGAFAIGLAPLQIIGGRLAEIYGSKWVLLAGCIGTGLTNLAIPYLAHFSFALSLVNRVLMGISQSGMEPGLMCLLSDWLTPQEASFFIAMLLCALCMGFFLGSLCSSFILAHGYGWPLTYYVCAGLNLSLALVWYVYADSWPRASKYITLDELKYIEEEQGNQKQQQPASRVVPSTSSTSSSFDLNNADDDECTSETTTATTSTTTKRTTVIAKPDGGKCELSLASSNISTGPRLDLVQEGGQRRVCDGFSKHLNNSKSSSDSSNINSNDNINSHNNNNNNANASKLTTVVELEDPLKAPWLNILSSRPVWAFIICKISIRWCGDVMANELPTYLANVLHLSIEINGLLNSISTALFAISSFITGWLVTSKMFTGKGDGGNFGLSSGGDHDDDDDLAVTTSNNNELNRRKTNLRKTFQSMASFGSAICLILMTNYDCDILISMSCLLLLSWFVVMGTGGELQIAYDMTSRYPGTLHGMACSLSVSGWLAPPLYGLILGDQPSSRARWAIVWYSTAAINVLGGLVFLLFADASPRDFDNPTAPQTKKKKMNEPNDLDEDHLNRRQLRSQKQQQQPPSPVDSQGYFNGALNTSSCESSPKSNHHHHHHHQQQQQQHHHHHQSVTDPLSQQNAKLNLLDAAASIGFDCGKLIKCRQLESSFIQANVFHKSGGYRLADSPLQLEANDLIYPYKEPRINRAIGNPQEDENTTTTNNTTTTTNTTSAKNNNNKPKGSIWSWLANLAQRTGTTTTTAAADAEVEGAPGGRTKSSSTPIDTHWKVSKSISVLANERAIETINQSRGSHDSNSSSIRLGLLDEHDNKRGSNGLGKHSDGRPSAAAAREPAAHQHGQPPRDGDDLAKNAAATGATAAAATVTSIIIKERMPGGEKNVPKASPLLETEGARQKTITHL